MLERFLEMKEKESWERYYDYVYRESENRESGEENSDKVLEYMADVFYDHGGLLAYISINGLEVQRRLKSSAIEENGQLNFYFLEYRDNNIGEEYKKGDLFFSFVGSDDNFQTRWGEIYPQFGVYAKEENYFKKIYSKIKIKNDLYKDNMGNIYFRNYYYDDLVANYKNKMFTGNGDEMAQIKDIIDVDTFQKIGNSEYYKDKNNVYYFISNSDGGHLEKIKNGDQSSFELLNAYFYAKDKNKVYYRGNNIEKADANTFEVISIILGTWRNRHTRTLQERMGLSRESSNLSVPILF